MVSPAMGATMMATIYFLRANCAQHGGGVRGGDLISASLLSYRALLSPVSVSSSRLRSPLLDQARIPTGNDVRPFEFRIQERQRTSIFRAVSGPANNVSL